MMCGKNCVTLFLLVSFVCPLFASPSKDTIVNEILNYQITLQNTKKQIENYETLIVSLQQTTQTLQIELENSKNESLQIISDIQKRLQESQALLEKSQQDLEELQILYKTLSMDLENLRKQLKLSQTFNKALGAGLLISLGYIALDHFF